MVLKIYNTLEDRLHTEVQGFGNVLNNDRKGDELLKENRTADGFNERDEWECNEMWKKKCRRNTK